MLLQYVHIEKTKNNINKFTTVHDIKLACRMPVKMRFLGYKFSVVEPWETATTMTTTAMATTTCTTLCPMFCVICKM